VEASAIPSAEYRPLPDSFYCPITFNLIQKPAIDPEGNTYERAAIEQWIRVNNNSPITRTAISVDQLYDNNAIADLMDEEKERSDESIHPSIRRWKEEAPPAATVTFDVEGGGPTTTTTTTTSTYPTTPEGIAARRRQRRVSPFTIVAFMVTIVVITLAVPFGAFWVLIFLISACLIFKINCGNTAHS
jgi:hypothetical protein